MPPICLSVVHQGTDEPAEVHRFDQQEVLVGRGEEVDLRLEHDSVSLVHLRLVRGQDGRLVALDVGSTNGSWLDGQPLRKPKVAAVGSRLVVGDYLIECLDPARAVPTSTASIARQAALDCLLEVATPPRLEVIGGPNRGLDAELPADGELVAGRGQGCGLRLTDADVSREHLALRVEGGTLVARDLGSKNGFWRGDEHITDQRSVTVQHGDELRLGLTVLRLVVPSKRITSDLGAVLDDEGADPGADPGTDPGTADDPASLPASASASDGGGDAATPPASGDARHAPEPAAPTRIGLGADEMAEDLAAITPVWRDPLMLAMGAAIVVAAGAAILYLAF